MIFGGGAIEGRARPIRGAAAKTAAEERGYEVTATPPVITSLRFRDRSELEYYLALPLSLARSVRPVSEGVLIHESTSSSSFSFPDSEDFTRIRRHYP